MKKSRGDLRLADLMAWISPRMPELMTLVMPAQAAEPKQEEGTTPTYGPSGTGRVGQLPLYK